MATVERGMSVREELVVQLVECPTPEPITDPEIAPAEGLWSTPAKKTQDATIEQTGAGPPPEPEA